MSPSGSPLGPYSESELLELAAKGEIAVDTFVWRDGMEEWSTLAETPELSRVANALSRAEREEEQASVEQYVADSWYGEGNVTEEGFDYYLEFRLVLRADGTFAWLTTHYEVDYLPNVESHRGRYEVTLLDDARFQLSLEREDGPFTCFFQIIGPDTIELEQLKLRMSRD